VHERVVGEVKMKVGMVTIGQSPRNDVISEIRGILGRLEIVERGCLDELTKEQIERLRPKEREPFLITLLRDGRSVQVSREKAIGLLQQRITELEIKDVTLIVLLCTGDFPNFESKKLVIMPGKLIHKIVQGMLTKERKLGVIIPSSEQIEQTKEKWIDVNRVVAVASPYENPEKVAEAAKTLQARNVDLTVLDCIGYTRQMKQKVKEITGKPVILACTILARVLRELLEN
jgi:protein AroM